VASDFPATRAIVIDDPLGPFGLVCDPTRTAEVAAAIRSMLELPQEAIASYRSRCVAASSGRWSWEAQAGRLVDLYAALLGPPRGRQPGTVGSCRRPPIRT
jgi:glycosyltransferase involved in cell wall biosynthesis